MRDIHGTVKLLGQQLGQLAKNCQVVVQVMDEQEKRIVKLEQELTCIKQGQDPELVALRARLEKLEIAMTHALPGFYIGGEVMLIPNPPRQVPHVHATCCPPGCEQVYNLVPP